MTPSSIPRVLTLASIFCIVTHLGVAANAEVSGTATPQAANDFAGQIMSDGKSGRVGIGTKEPAATLDVYQGEVKIGSTGAPCTKALAGTIRFADDQLQVCNSYGRRPLATSVPPE